MEKILEKGDKIKKTQEDMNKCMNSKAACLNRMGCLLVLLCLVLTLTVILVLRLIQKIDPNAFQDLKGDLYNSTVGQLNKLNGTRL